LCAAAGREIVIQADMIELSVPARQRVTDLFAEEDVAEAEQLLQHCTDDPRLIADVTRQGIDRFLLAMIRLSGGQLDRLGAAISLFRRDWRDLLCAAGFEEVAAHLAWRPRRLDGDTRRRWSEGDRTAGFEFLENEEVEILRGTDRGRKARIAAILSFEPEPRYLVYLDDGNTREAYERTLLRSAR
jgi:hypothetical protein